MRVSGSSAGNRISNAKKSKRGSSAASAFVLEPASGNAPAPQTSEVSAPGSINNIEALLALQAAPDPVAKRKRALRRADDMLDLLEDIRIGLLNGRVSEERLRQLSQLAAKHHGMAADTRLGDLLDGIELRARVELAKLGR